MPPRLDGTNFNPEIFKPKPVEPKIEKPKLPETKVLPNADRNLFLGQSNLGGNALKINLFARFDQNNVGGFPQLPQLPQLPPVSPIDAEKVSAAVDSIKDRLSQSWTDWDVSHSDLTGIQETFQNLNPAEADEVFNGLSESDLNAWANELDGAGGGFDGDEKKALFDELAGKLNDQNLARFVNALGDEENIQSLADSVANNASTETKVGLINTMTGLVETNEKSAIAVAELIGGLGNDTAALDGVLNGLSQPQLSAIIKAASQEEIETPLFSNTVYTTFDPSPLVDMLNAVSNSSNPELKANVFQAASLELKRIEEAGGLFVPAVGKEDASKQVRDAMTGLLNSDTTGIVRELEHNFRNGDGITAYVKSMLNAGETAQLGNTIAQLSKGNTLTGDPLARFGEQVTGTDGNPHYQNAQVLGYFAGALLAGAKQITGDRTKQADMLKNVFGTIAGATGAANPAAGVASSVVNGLTSAIVTEITDGLNKGTMDVEEALNQLIFPRSTATGDTYEGAAEADYDSAFSRVVLRNQ